jgi:rubrerythrin
MPLLRTSLLKAEPAGTLHSLDELFALASAMEQEAASRYAELADEMRRQNKPDLSAVFTQLAAAEREHVDSVGRWSRSRLGRAPDPALVRWEGPGTVDAEAAVEIATSRLMTPYRALSMAVRNEERAFAFWSYLAALAEDNEIKKAAEAMAREELDHVSTLRKERRRAYHRQYDEVPEGGQGGVTGRRIDASEMERRLAAHLSELERGLAGASADRAHELVLETTDMAAKATGLGRFAPGVAMGNAEALAEALADAYLEGAERTGDVAHLESLQGLAKRAIARLAWLRSLSLKTP